MVNVSKLKKKLSLTFSFHSKHTYKVDNRGVDRTSIRKTWKTGPERVYSSHTFRNPFLFTSHPRFRPQIYLRTDTVTLL